MPVVPHAKVAFRCRHCGRLHEAGHAAENPVPNACRVCGRGVAYAPTHEALRDHAHVCPHPAAVSAVKDAKPARGYQPGCRVMELSFPGVSVFKAFVPENWEVLADATDTRLAELGLTRADVEGHTPWPKGTAPREAKLVAAAAADGPVTTDSAG